MSNQQELINEALIVADKGLYHKDKIRQVIKADFYNQNTGRISVLGLREKLSKKYGVCLANNLQYYKRVTTILLTNIIIISSYIYNL
jgi:hypothetical protein